MIARVLVERWLGGESLVVKWGVLEEGENERDSISTVLAGELEADGSAVARAVRESSHAIPLSELEQMAGL